MANCLVNDEREFMQAQAELGMQNRQFVEAMKQQQLHAVPVQQPHATAPNIPFALVPGQAFSNISWDYYLHRAQTLGAQHQGTPIIL